VKSAHVGRTKPPRQRQPPHTAAAAAVTTSIPFVALATATERDMLCYLFLPAGLPVVPAVSTFNFQGLSKKNFQLSRVRLMIL
jgi:hypothetical protein